ncbi:hypothetical protein ABZ815_19950 [Nonomuraea sp. NPDC047529]|uniref:hypothetical protein n=1 Tax=Nonomuraea sp. NPDC047529 TaxID=3155623 RepID=UPI0033C7A462
MGWSDLTGCSDIPVNGTPGAAGGAQVTTRAVIHESLAPFRTLFDQSVTYNDV